MRMQEICKISGFTKELFTIILRKDYFLLLLMFRTVIMIFQRKK